jgi:hypothetical protein
MNKDKSCADLIAGELKDRELQLEQLYTAIDSGDEMRESDARDELYSMAYGIDRREIVRIVWSGGGPADYLEITHSGGDIIRVEYLYQDWYDGARIEVLEGSAAYRYAEEMMELEMAGR